jgi:hypothetical protein
VDGLWRCEGIVLCFGRQPGYRDAGVEIGSARI